jgi:hypothetical protein
MKYKLLFLIPLLLISFTFISAIDISTCEELQNMTIDLSANYELINNIDCSDTINWNNDTGFISIGDDINSFTGTFDGNGYAIDELYINNNSKNYVGLFGNSSGTISNVNLENGNINGYVAVGILVGNNGGTIQNCFSSGTVSGYISVGGLVGQNIGTIDYSYSSTTTTGYMYIGGLVGQNGEGGFINNSYAIGDVNGNRYVGGFAGKNFYGTIDYSYSIGEVTADTNYLGGFISDNGGTTINCFWDMNTSGRSSDGDGSICIGKTTLLILIGILLHQ